MATKEIKVQGLTLYVTDEHVHHKGEFIFHCKELNFKEVILKSREVTLAVREAVSQIDRYLSAKLQAIQIIQQQLE